jgi:endonuclease/exonuclease/phosphatase family metal-dependent hydrolase
VTLLVRSWNVYHGRTLSPGRRAYLEEAVGLATNDEPDILCLQELPLWSLGQLEAWSAMAMFAARTRHRLGRLGRRPTDLHHGKLGSLLTGQANAVLVARRHTASDHRRLVLNDRAFVMREGRRLGLGLGVIFAWSVERRVCQALRVRPAGGPPVVVLNLHATHLRDRRCAEAELRRAVRFGEELAAVGEPLVVAGDFNLTAASPAVSELTEAGFSPAAPGIDHILVRGAPSTPPVVWPEERRRVNGRILSDHPPVELELAAEVARVPRQA